MFVTTGPRASAEFVMTAEPASSPCHPLPEYLEGPGEPWQTLAVHRALSAGIGAEPTGFAACALAGDIQAAGEARQFTRTTLRDWDLTRLADSVTVIVSEMLSNAMRHGMARPSPDHVPSHRPVWLGLLRQGVGVLCTVSDPSTEVPVLREPDFLAESGRGLHLIDSLSESWGWTTPDHAGKSVWAMVSAGRGD
jgi:hypothetical protein